MRKATDFCIEDAKSETPVVCPAHVYPEAIGNRDKSGSSHLGAKIQFAFPAMMDQSAQKL